MKKILTLALILGTSIVVVPAVQAKALSGAAVADPQIRVQIGQQRRGRRNSRRTRTVTRTRITRIRRYRYRETVRITYLPNGRTRTAVISRVRLGRAW